ncbi:MAG TPA: flavin reductase family protein [Azospirillaceae bacterium]|nr:flavin reductase family protein [Azospirillaceae bacterium]
MTFDSRDFRTALGCFATGVTVVTTLDAERQPVGVTVNSFTSVSLAPPLVLFCLGRTAQSVAAFEATGAFAVNMLADDQQELSLRFASRERADRWNGVAWESWDTGCPILTGSLAILECDREAVHDGGDHLILVGRVRRLASRTDGKPLLYFRGAYGTVA